MRISEMPQQIRQHFFSEAADAVLTRITRQAGFQDPSSLPSVLFRLLIKEVPPHDFIESLISEGNIDIERAKAVARALKEQILETERYALFQWGVDISDIKTGDAPNLKDIAPESAGSKLEEKNIDITEIGSGNESVFVPIQKEPVPASIPAPAPLSDAPFIIHEEKSIEAAGAGKTAPKGFSIPLGFFKSKNRTAEASLPVRANVESPAKSEKRVVNYSELRTSLSPFEGAQGFINPVRNSPPLGPSGAPSNETGSRVPVIEFHEGEGKIPGPAPMPTIKTDTENKSPEARPTAPETVRADSEKTGSIVGTIKRTEPKIEGNVIDLSR